MSEKLTYWRGYTPYYAGCFYGDSTVLYGEEKYSKCFDFHSGVIDEMWWIKSELDKLTESEADELVALMERNKAFDEYLNKIIPELAKIFEVEPYQIHRLPNKVLFFLLKTIEANRNQVS